MSRKFYSILDKAVREIGFSSIHVHTINAFLKVIQENIKRIVEKLETEEHYTMAIACGQLESLYNIPYEICAELITAYMNENKDTKHSCIVARHTTVVSQ